MTFILIAILFVHCKRVLCERMGTSLSHSRPIWGRYQRYTQDNPPIASLRLNIPSLVILRFVNKCPEFNIQLDNDRKSIITVFQCLNVGCVNDTNTQKLHCPIEMFRLRFCFVSLFCVETKVHCEKSDEINAMQTHGKGKRHKKLELDALFVRPSAR